MTDKKYYYLRDVEIPSALNTMEKILSEQLRQYAKSIVSLTAIERIKAELEEAQRTLKAEKPRLAVVDIQITDESYGVRWLMVGRNQVTFQKVERIVEE